MPFDNSERPQTVASKMRALLGPNGENWCKGAYSRPHVDLERRAVDGMSFCLMGAYLTATGVPLPDLYPPPAPWYHRYCQDVLQADISLIRHTSAERRSQLNAFSVPGFNDKADWADIIATLERLEESEIKAQMMGQVAA